ncbi:MAG TPA: hypothetical protein VH501_09805 [Solirubrobacterales bacterium]|jgi:hypothetical protein
MIVSVIALVLAVSGTAVAASSLKGNLKLAWFQSDSRDRLAGTGVIQYAAAPYTTPKTTDSFDTVHTYAVKCELSKKATSGGFKWTGNPPHHGDYQVLDAYPNGSGFVVRLQLRPDDPMTPADEGTALNKPISVYANCVKSRTQRGAPPA